MFQVWLQIEGGEGKRMLSTDRGSRCPMAPQWVVMEL